MPNQFRVVSSENAATFIKDLVLEPEPGTPLPPYQPGDYMQLDIPAHREISFQEIAVQPAFAEVWKTQDVHHPEAPYQLFNNSSTDSTCTDLTKEFPT